MKRLLIVFFLFAVVSHAGCSVFAAEKMNPKKVLEYTVGVADQVQNAFPEFAPSHFAMGYVYYRARKYEEAIEAFKKGLEYEPGKASIVQMVAFLYARLPDYENAVDWYQKTLRLDPGAPQANKRLGQALEKLNRMEEARDAFEAELKYNPTDASCHFYLGQRYFDEGRLDEARREAEAASKYNSLLPEPYYLLSKIYRQQGDQDAAKKMLETFREKKKEEEKYMDETVVEKTDQENANASAAAVHFDVASIYYQRNRLNESRFHFLKTLSFDPKSEEARFRLAQVYQDLEQPKKAETLFRELLTMNGEDHRYYLGLGLILASQKDWKNAHQALAKAHELNPDDNAVKRGLAKTFLYSSSKEGPQKAIELLESVVSSEPTAEAYDILSWAYYSHGDADLCLRSIRKAIDLDPNNPVYRQRYEKILSRVRKR